MDSCAVAAIRWLVRIFEATDPKHQVGSTRLNAGRKVEIGHVRELGGNFGWFLRFTEATGHQDDRQYDDQSDQQADRRAADYSTDSKTSSFQSCLSANIS